MITRSISSKKIRLLSVCPQLVPDGAERQLVYFCKHAHRDRLDIRIVFYESDDSLRPALAELGIDVIHLDRARLGPWGLLKTLRREIVTYRPDVLDCRLPSAYRFGRLAALGTGVPVVIAQERTAARGSAARRLFDRMLNRWTDAWIGNSKAVAAHIIRDLHVAPDRVHVIYNGIDAAGFRAAVIHPLLARLKNEGRRIVLNVGRLIQGKNQRLFLRVGRRLNQRFSNLAFGLCGTGPLRGALESYAAELGMADACHFLGQQKDMAPVLAAADLFIQTSDQEGLPNAVMEAMAAGVPVVATAAGGTEELIQDGTSGFIVPVGDEAGLEDAASKVLLDRRLAGQLAEAASAEVRRRFTAVAMARAYSELLEDLLARKNACPSVRARQA